MSNYYEHGARLHPDYHDETYNAPMPVVNAAVYETFSLYLQDAVPTPEVMPGVVCYRAIQLPNNVIITLSVLHRAEAITTIRTQLYLPTDREMLKQMIAIHPAIHVIYLLDRISDAIVRAIRYSHPTFTQEDIRGVTEPMPTLDDGWIAIARWRGVNMPGMTDKQLAKQLNVSYGTVRNAMSKLAHDSGRTLTQRAEPKLPPGRPRKKGSDTK